MELNSSAITGALRVGVQIASSYRSPRIEVYWQLHNRSGPEVEHSIQDSRGNSDISKHRMHDVFVNFFMVNVGGSRAEKINIEVSGDLRRDGLREDLGEFLEHEIPQMPPGQSHNLFRFDVHDFNEYPEGGGSPLGLKKEKLILTTSYDPESTFINKIMCLPWKLLKKKRYTNQFTFLPQMISGDLPPVEYVG